MVELSNERITQILYEETPKKEKLNTILRSIYIRYMRLYEKYFADIDALNDDEIAKFRAYNEETRSLEKYFYMDIPQDICMEIEKFDNKYGDNLLGPKWHKFLFDIYENFKKSEKYKSEEALKEEFKNQMLRYFYEQMDDIFRVGFGTYSESAKDVVSGIKGLLFGEEY